MNTPIGNKIFQCQGLMKIYIIARGIWGMLILFDLRRIALNLYHRTVYTLAKIIRFTTRSTG
jgi:hypothetical protein